MDDLISRQAEIGLKSEFLNPNVNRETEEQTAIDRAYARGWNSCNTHWIDEISELPSAQPDLSSYSDKLWRNAYERGKAEAQAEIIRCRDCKYYREYGYVNGKPKFLPKCIFSSIYVNADDFCSRAERRTDEPDR